MSRGPITLPQWSAVFPADRAPGGDHRRVGPFAILAADDTLQTATFGSPHDPGCVLFEGYLFDRADLRRELQLAADAPDAVIAAAAFERWRDDVFDRLDGSYLLLIWDARTGRLLLGHDPLGHHPAYYVSSSDTAWFGSNILALSQCALNRRRPNLVSIAQLVLGHWPAAGDTVFEGIHRVDAGSYVTFDRQLAMRATKYFAPWLQEGERELSPEEVHEQFEPMLVQAVARRMELQPNGIMLSGGVDSVTIAAIAAEYAATHNTPLITAVSGRRDHTLRSDDVAQTATTEALKMRHIIDYRTDWMGGKDDVELALEVTPRLPGPSTTYWVGGYTRFYRRSADLGVDVLLTGSGGDNWVSVWDEYAAECMRRFDYKELRRFFRSYTGLAGLSTRDAWRILIWSGGVRVLLDILAAKTMPGLKNAYHRRRAMSALPQWIAPDSALRDRLADTRWRYRAPALTADGRMPPNLYRHAQRTSTNPFYVYEFEVGFHIRSMCGLRLFSPYHDRRLVKLLNAISPEMLMQGSTYKGLLRNVGDRRLPNLGLRHQTKAFDPDMSMMIYKEHKAAVLKTWPKFEFQALNDLGFLNEPAARQALTAVNARERAAMSTLMSAEYWVRAHSAA